MKKGLSPRISLGINLMDLPPFNMVSHYWKQMTVANLGIRREAKSLMFHELSAATARGVALEDALALVSQTWYERLMEETTGKRNGADSRDWMGIHLFVIFFLICLTSGLFLLLFLSPTSGDPERVARIFALRLEAYIRKGFTLSQAMERYPLDYSREEVALMRAAEQRGKLPEALRRLSDYQVTNSRQYSMGSSLSYPFLLGMMSIVIVSFITFRIYPKFTDIFQQMGAELPAVTQMMVHASYIISHSITLPFLIFFVGGFFLLRTLLNGNAFIRTFLCTIALSWLFIIIVLVTKGIIESTGILSGNSVPYIVRDLEGPLSLGFGALLGLIICFVFVPLSMFLIYLLEIIIISGERLLGFILMQFPFIRSAARIELEARWLSAFSMMMETETNEVDALRHAAQIGGNKFARASLVAAHLVENGIPLAQAFERAKILPQRLSFRVSFALNGKDLPVRLREIADEQSTFALENSQRMATAVEVFSVLLIGFIVFCVLLSIYLPIFHIPTLVTFSSAQ